MKHQSISDNAKQASFSASRASQEVGLTGANFFSHPLRQASSTLQALFLDISLKTKSTFQNDARWFNCDHVGGKEAT